MAARPHLAYDRAVMPEPLPAQVDIAIVGAGAAGLATAIFAACRCPDQSIALLDGAAKLGAKILVAGGGRCNVTNRVVTPADFSGGNPHLIRRALAALPVDATIAWFREIGVDLHEEEHGKLFPDTNRAHTVLNALLREAERRGVRIAAGHRVTAAQRAETGFLVATNGGVLCSRALVLATGGLSLPKTGSDGAGYGLARSLGHTVVPTTPALDPLVLAGDFHVGLSGISHEVEISATAVGQKPVRRCGALLWTHFGISGPVVLDISRHWHRARLEQLDVSVALSFLPGHTYEQAERKLLDLLAARPRTTLRGALADWLPARVGEAVLRRLSIAEERRLNQLTREDRRSLIRALLSWPLPVCGGRGYNYAEATAGGVPLHEVDAGDMASRCCPGLFLVGEMLNVDGRIGGFNFQWAWSTAWVAALGLANLGRNDT